MDQSEPRFNRKPRPPKIIEVSTPGYHGPKFDLPEGAMVGSTPFTVTGVIHMNTKMHVDEAKAQGFTIDNTCYPWYAYKGPRFAPTEWKLCFTDLETDLLRKNLKLTLTLDESAKTGDPPPKFARKLPARQAKTMTPEDLRFAQVVQNLNRNDAAQARINAERAKRFQVPGGSAALLFMLTVEMKRVFYNVRGVNWETDCDPGVEGIVWRPTWKGHWRDPKALLPRFEFTDVQLWFAEPGRKMEANRELSATDWFVWYERCHHHIIQWGEDHKYDRRNAEEDARLAAIDADEDYGSQWDGTDDRL